MDKSAFAQLANYLEKVPAIRCPITSGVDESGFWWIKFRIDITHKLAWNLIQELGCVINYLSLNERLPTVFYLVSPAPYLNGGPIDFLSWVIETKDKKFMPDELMQWLEGRLPNPVDDLNEWNLD